MSRGLGVGRTGRGPAAHLVDLVPAVLVLAADGRALVQEQLAAVGVAPDDGRVVQRREPVAVLVVRGGAELQEGLEKHTESAAMAVTAPWGREGHHLERGSRATPRPRPQAPGPAPSGRPSAVVPGLSSENDVPALTTRFPALKAHGARHAG